MPTGAELVADYLEPLAALPALARHIHLNSRVVAVTRRGSDKVRTAGREGLPFVLRIEGPDGAQRSVEARAVIDASGTWTTPNPSGADGLPAIGETAAAGRIATGIPGRAGQGARPLCRQDDGRHWRRPFGVECPDRVPRCGTEAPGTRILWIMRKERIEAAPFGGEELDGLPDRGALGVRCGPLSKAGRLMF